ncbi:hypothetical protein AMELA_G00090230 [Ameiurus melas]|uniref:Uncharacterized protein n=1 Tax=Ameiurus melas TaxID=219545 RepID=A0A7J6AWD8_AMEME|nr:hypothetical protein AMELA_G00090230 [Ameiurus melas]
MNFLCMRGRRPGNHEPRVDVIIARPLLAFRACVPAPFSFEAHEAYTCQLKVITKLIIKLVKNKQKHSRATMISCFCSATDHRPGSDGHREMCR